MMVNKLCLVKLRDVKDETGMRNNTENSSKCASSRMRNLLRVSQGIMRVPFHVRKRLWRKNSRSKHSDQWIYDGVVVLVCIERCAWEGLQAQEMCESKCSSIFKPMSESTPFLASECSPLVAR